MLTQHRQRTSGRVDMGRTGLVGLGANNSNQSLLIQEDNGA